MHNSPLIMSLTLLCHRSGTLHSRQPQVRLRLRSSTTSCTHQSKELTDDGVPSPPSANTGEVQFPFPTYEAAASQFVSASRIDSRGFAYHVFSQAPSSAAPLPIFNFADLFQPEQAAGALPSWLMGDGFSMLGYASTSDLMNMDGYP
jgi:hypothetical protein